MPHIPTRLRRIGATVALAGGLVAAAALQAAAQPPPPTADQALGQAMAISLKLREGHYDLAPQSVALLEAAVAREPGDKRLWNALGVAYFQQITADFQTNAFKDIPGHLRKAQAAHEQALAIDPNDPVALAGQGTAWAIAAGFTARPDVGRRGVEQLNRAAALAPNITQIRLQRGFTNLGVSADLRDRAAAETELKHLIGLSEGTRPGDVLHILLGDFQAEGGHPDLAGAEYRAAARPASAVREMAEGRLAALAAGGPPPAEVARLRGEIARNCAMCHTY